MQVIDLLRKDIMIMDLQAQEKESVIDEMIKSLEAHGGVNDFASFKEAILAREAQTSTGLGDGIAMPHARHQAVKEPTVLFAKSKSGVEFESLDGQPTYLFFMIAVPDGEDDTHLQTLAALSRKLIDPDFVEKLKQVTTPDEVQDLFSKAEGDEAEEKEETTESDKTEVTQEEKPFIVAVTACPTGIAHTYMAEDALKQKAAEMNVNIRVETNGSDGAKHKLTTEEIERADAVIIAASKKVEMDRFHGKPLLDRSVSDGISKAEELITKAVKKDAPIYHSSDGGEKAENNTAKTSAGSIWNKIYKDLMNGISHMLPFVVGGGILMAISFLVERFVGDESQIFLFLNGAFL